MAIDISYNTIKIGATPIFNGIYFNELIYEYKIENSADSSSTYNKNRKVSLHNVLDHICERHLPSILSENHRIIYKDQNLILECGEGSYGGIGYLCLSTVDEQIIFLACFEESNPFVAAEYNNGCIRAMNNIFEMWTFRFGYDCLPELTIEKIDGCKLEGSSESGNK